LAQRGGGEGREGGLEEEKRRRQGKAICAEYFYAEIEGRGGKKRGNHARMTAHYFIRIGPEEGGKNLERREVSAHESLLHFYIRCRVLADRERKKERK